MTTASSAKATRRTLPFPQVWPPHLYALAATTLACSQSPDRTSTEPFAPPQQSERQLRYSESPNAIPPGVRDDVCMDALVVDLDSDGHLDVVLAIEFGANRILLNDGSGQFELLRDTPQTQRDSEDALALDTDSDGDLDLLFVSEDDRVNEYFANSSVSAGETTSSLTFEPSPFPLPSTGISNGAVVADVDKDGVLEILVANDGKNFLFVGNGNGQFTDASSERFPDSDATSQDIEVGDIDGDGDLDALWANEGQNELWLNAGGTFVDATERLPVMEDETREIDLGDVDNDGDLDIVVGNVRLFTALSPDNRVLLNDGDGHFSNLEGALVADGLSTFDVDLADLNGDDIVDLITANWLNRGPGPYQVHLGRGDGNFDLLDLPELPSSEAGLDVEAADFNGDGILDLYFCSRGGIGLGGSRDHVLIGQ